MKWNDKESIVSFLILTCTIFFMFGVRIFQVGYLHTSNGVKINEFSNFVKENRSSVTGASRGVIYDSKNQPIAMNATSYSLYAILAHQNQDLKIKDVDLTAETLAKYIPMDRNQIIEILRTPNLGQVEFGSAGRAISEETKRLIDAENLPGIHFTAHESRTYINPYFASHLIGYASPEGEDGEDPLKLKGMMGVEAEYNQFLSARNQGPVNNLYLTLDSRIQNSLEDILSQTQVKYNPKKLGAYLVEMPSGKLLAASQRPTFNLNTREGIENEWRNYLIEEAFEPGSTIKILTMATAYDQKVFRSDEMYMSGKVNIYGMDIHDHNRVGWGQITFEEGLARSSNTAMLELVRRMGEDQWAEKLKTFGFGQTTQFGLEGEIEGTLAFDNPVSKYMSSFGQAFSATPIQLLQAYSAIANKGQMIKVQTVESLNQNQPYRPKALNQVVSSQAADYMLNLMVKTVEEEYGTAQPFYSQKVRVAAKTGTAQIGNEDGTGYLTGENDYLHSVIAFFPAENPKYMVYMFMQQPEQSYGLLGSQILGEMFQSLVDTIMITENP